MLDISRDRFGITMYTVCNDQGVMLIYTSDATLARFVSKHVDRGVDPELRLRIGGDEGTAHVLDAPIWTHVRRFNK